MKLALLRDCRGVSLFNLGAFALVLALPILRVSLFHACGLLEPLSLLAEALDLHPRLAKIVQGRGYGWLRHICFARSFVEILVRRVNFADDIVPAVCLGGLVSHDSPRW